MSRPLLWKPQLVRALPGCIRVALLGWSGADADRVEESTCALPGIHSARGNPRTANVLVQFDPTISSSARVLRALRCYGSTPTLRILLPPLGAELPSQALQPKLNPASAFQTTLRLSWLVIRLLTGKSHGVSAPSTWAEVLDTLAGLGWLPRPLRGRSGQSALLSGHLIRLLTSVLARNPLGAALAAAEAFLCLVALYSSSGLS
jgi:hypothetical protein